MLVDTSYATDGQGNLIPFMQAAPMPNQQKLQPTQFMIDQNGNRFPVLQMDQQQPRGTMMNQFSISPIHMPMNGQQEQAS